MNRLSSVSKKSGALQFVRHQKHIEELRQPLGTEQRTQ